MPKTLSNEKSSKEKIKNSTTIYEKTIDAETWPANERKCFSLSFTVFIWVLRAKFVRIVPQPVSLFRGENSLLCVCMLCLIVCDLTRAVCTLSFRVLCNV